MNIDLTKLITGITDRLDINEEINIDENYLDSSEIKDISKVIVKGFIYPYEGNYELSLNIKCTLTLVCSISLEDVNYNVDININELISDDISSKEIEENNKIINNTIDLIPIIWQNIILEVPLKVVSPNIKPENVKGDGWRFITDEKEIEKDIDPRLEKLKEFLDE